MAQCFQMLSEKHCRARILHAAELYFRSEGKIETFSDEGRLIGFATERPMQKMSKGSAQHMKETVKEGTLGHRKESMVSKTWVNKISSPSLLEFSDYI